MKAHRRLVTSGLALASAAVIAAGAQAAVRPDDRGGMLGIGAAQVVAAPPDAFERAALRATEAVPPDAFERAVLRAMGDVVRPDDRAGARGPGVVGPALASSAAPVDGGFRWSDALLGAAGTFGILALGAVAALTIRSRRRVILP